MSAVPDRCLVPVLQSRHPLVSTVRAAPGETKETMPALQVDSVEDWLALPERVMLAVDAIELAIRDEYLVELVLPKLWRIRADGSLLHTFRTLN